MFNFAKKIEIMAILIIIWGVVYFFNELLNGGKD